MAYQVIARKWRPQKFEEVTGQEAITRTLRNAIEHDRLHHAYLFSGARGVGKTTTARLLAKALNCHKSDRPTPGPCAADDPAACASCREIAEGRSIDVLEIDAASNTGVDNVREAIINTVAVRPARDRFKVFIVDEVHMLSGAAFNALLKTLEEPPPRVVFIMATTESHKIPDTILSRSQQFEFRTIAAAKIAERLRHIAREEQIEVTDDALREIARAGEGSMRDAQSAFDQVISFSTGAIEVEDVETALGLASTEMRSRVVRAIADGRPADALAVVDDLVMRGHDLRNFCRDLLAHVRNLLMAKVGGGAAELTDAERDELTAAAGFFSESDLVRFFHSLTETERLLRESAHPRYQLEMGLVRLVEMRRLAPLGQILERLAALEEALRTGKAPAGGTGGAPPAQPTPAAGGGSSTPPRRGSAGGRLAVGDAGTASNAAEPAGGAPAAFAAAPGGNDASSPGRASAPANGSTAAPSVLEARRDGPAPGAEAFEPPPFFDEAAPPFEPSPFEAEEAPPFEPPPPRAASPTTTKAPGSRVKPIPSLPSRGGASPTTAGSVASVPSPPSKMSAPPPPPNDATRPAPPPSATTHAAQASRPPDTPQPAGLRLVPLPSSPDAAAASFFDAAPAADGLFGPVDTTSRPTFEESPAVSSADAPPSVAAAPESGLLSRVKCLLDERRKPFLSIALEGARKVEFEGEELYVEFTPEGKHLRDTLAKPDNAKVLREVCGEVAGRGVGVRIVVREPGDGEDEPRQTAQDEARLEKQRLRELAEQHPDVQKMLRTFRAEIIDVVRVEEAAPPAPPKRL